MFLHDIYARFVSLSRWKKITVITLVLLATGALLIVRARQGQTGYVFEKAKRTTITELVSDSGKITSDGKVDVYSPTNGIIQDVYVENGRHVNEDDQLFKVKSSATMAEQQVAYASYQAAVAAQNAAEILLHTYRSGMYTRWKTFLDLATNATYESSKGVPNETERASAEFQTSKENWLSAEKQYIDQQQAVSAAAAQVQAAWTTYMATQTSVVTAQTSGIVNNLSVSSGKSVTVPSALNPTAPPVLTLVNSATVEAVLAIGQTDIAKVKTGQPVKVHPDAYKDATYDAKVVRVDTLGQDVMGVVTYNVYIQFTGSDDILRPGMTVDADITTNTRENVLTVPNSAIVLYKGGKTVRVVKNNVVSYIPVSVGIKGDTRTQILSGITEGTTIIVALTNEKAARPSFMGL